MRHSSSLPKVDTVQSSLKYNSSLSSRWAEKIARYTKRILPLKDEIFGIEMNPVNRDINLLETLEREMSTVEGRMVEEVKKTDSSFLLGKIKGLPI